MMATTTARWRLDAAITPDTRPSPSRVSWTTGAVKPHAGIAELAHARGALQVVDGAKGAGALPFRFDDLGADLYAVPAQKWLLGPEGMGALVVDPATIDRLTPVLGGWFSFEQVDSRGTAVWWSDGRRFESGGFHRPSVVGMARSIGWLSMFVGLDFVHRHGLAMAALAATRLAAIPGVSVLTPTSRMATLVTFRIAGWSAQAALDELGARVFTIARTIASLDALRISVGFHLRGGTGAAGGRIELLASLTRDHPATARAGHPGRGVTEGRSPAAAPPRRSWAMSMAVQARAPRRGRWSPA
jgi:L-cysteine/cystine lyase